MAQTVYTTIYCHLDIEIYESEQSDCNVFKDFTTDCYLFKDFTIYYLCLFLYLPQKQSFHTGFGYCEYFFLCGIELFVLKSWF